MMVEISFCRLLKAVPAGAHGLPDARWACGGPADRIVPEKQ